MKHTDNKGVVVLIALFFLVALLGVGMALMSLFSAQSKSVGVSMDDMRAYELAEAGRAKARYMLTTGGATVPAPPAYWTETATAPFGAGNGSYVVKAEYTDSPTNSVILITSDGYYPSNTAPRAHRVVTESSISGGGGGGANLSTVPGVVASVSSGPNPNYIRDNDTGTTWRSATNGNSWVRLDYGSAQNIGKVTVTGQTLGAAVVQYSNTGAFPGTNVSSPVGAFGNNGTYTQTFTPFTARYIFLSIPTGNRPRIRELETYDASGLAKGTFGTSG